MFNCIKVLLSLLLTAAAASASDEAKIWKQALIALQASQFGESVKLHRRLLDLNPQKALYWFNDGISYFGLKDYRRAAICFGNVERLKSPLTPAARLYRAKALAFEGKSETALRILRRLSTAKETPPGIRAEATQDFNELLIVLKKDREEEKSIWLFLEAAGGGGPKGPTAMGTLSAGYRFWQKDDWFANAGYNGSVSEAFEHSDLSVRSHELRGNAGRESKNLALILSPYFDHDSYDGTAARLAEGAALKIRTNTDSLEYGMEADFALQQKGSSDYDYLAGQTFRATAFGGWVHSPTYARIGLFYENQALGDQTFADGSQLPWAYSGYGIDVRSLRRFGAKWFLDSSLRFTFRNYPNVTKPDLETRKDALRELTARLSRKLKPGLYAFISVSHRQNVSTLGPLSVKNENYTETQGLLGLSWDAL